jgi:hypothetical protein
VVFFFGGRVQLGWACASKGDPGHNMTKRPKFLFLHRSGLVAEAEQAQASPDQMPMFAKWSA